MTFLNIQTLNILTTNTDLTQSAHFKEKFICPFIFEQLTAMPHEMGVHIVSNCTNGSFSSSKYIINVLYEWSQTLILISYYYYYSF